MERYAKSLGYYKVVVKSKIEGKRAYIYILKNEPIKIESLIIDSRFKRISLLTVGARFKTKNFTETKSRIERRLEESGYPNYEMRARAIVDLDLYRVDINITVEKGRERLEIRI